MIIGGHFFVHVSPLANFVSTNAYDQDSFTWCIPHAEKIPKWQNIIKIVKDVELLALCGVLFPFVVILSYFQGAYEHWRYDVCTMSLKVFQLLIGNVTILKVKLVTTRSIVIIELWASMLFFITVSSYAMICMHRSHEYYQVRNRMELATEKYQLAGDQHTLDLLWESKMVGIPTRIYDLIFWISVLNANLFFR